jgi:hypothetical protein
VATQLFLRDRQRLFQSHLASSWASALFIAVAAIAYILCPQYLIQHHDGKFYFVLIRNLVTWSDATPLGLSTSPLAGMSAVFPPLAPQLVPTLWGFFIKMDAYWQVYATHVSSAIFLYFSTGLMARSLGFDRVAGVGSRVAAFFYCMLLQDAVVAAPAVPFLMTWCNLMLALFAQLGQAPPVRTAALGFCFVGLSVWAFAAMGYMPILAAPGLALLLAGLIFGSSSRREALTKLGWASLTLAVVLSLRIPEFIDLVTRYTARAALSQDMEQQAVSFFTAGPVFRDELASWVLLAFGFAGAAALLWPAAGPRSQKGLAAAFLLFLMALTIVGSARSGCLR